MYSMYTFKVQRPPLNIMRRSKWCTWGGLTLTSAVTTSVGPVLLLSPGLKLFNGVAVAPPWGLVNFVLKNSDCLRFVLIRLTEHVVSREKWIPLCTSHIRQSEPGSRVTAWDWCKKCNAFSGPSLWYSQKTADKWTIFSYTQCMEKSSLCSECLRLEYVNEYEMFSSKMADYQHVLQWHVHMLPCSFLQYMKCSLVTEMSTKKIPYSPI